MIASDTTFHHSLPMLAVLTQTHAQICHVSSATNSCKLYANIFKSQMIIPIIDLQFCLLTKEAIGVLKPQISTYDQWLI